MRSLNARTIAKNARKRHVATLPRAHFRLNRARRTGCQARQVVWQLVARQFCRRSAGSGQQPGARRAFPRAPRSARAVAAGSRSLRRRCPLCPCLLLPLPADCRQPSPPSPPPLRRLFVALSPWLASPNPSKLWHFAREWQVGGPEVSKKPCFARFSQRGGRFPRQLARMPPRHSPCPLARRHTAPHPRRTAGQKRRVAAGLTTLQPPFLLKEKRRNGGRLTAAPM